MKTYVTQEATKLCAELFALSGGRHYGRDGRLARTLAASFAGTALRPPLPLAQYDMRHVHGCENARWHTGGLMLAARFSNTYH
jgi:hypothetical protein